MFSVIKVENSVIIGVVKMGIVLTVYVYVKKVMGDRIVQKVLLQLVVVTWVELLILIKFWIKMKIIVFLSINVVLLMMPVVVL